MKRYKNIDLCNGAKLFYVKNNISRTTMVDVVFNCGSRCDEIPGLAHFTEHMFFNGTKQHDKKAITKKYYDFINTNACTNHAKIYFTGNIFTKEFKDYLNTVSEMVAESTMTEKEVQNERKVINQEIAVYKDNNQMNAYYFNDYNLARDDLYKYANLGSTDTIATIKSKDVKNFVKKYFVQENMEVYVSSPLSVGKVKNIVQKTLCARIPTNNKFKELPLFKFKVQDETFFEIETKDIGKNYLFMNFAFDADFKDVKLRKKLELLLELMNNLSEGIMNDLRWGSDKNLTYSGRFYNYFGDGKGIITFNTQCDKENITPIIETIANYVQKVLKNGFSQKTLDFEKREYKYDDDAREPSLRRKFSKLFDYKLFGEVRDPKLMRKYVTETTLDECNALFHRIFENPRMSVSVYGDATKKDILTKSKMDKLFDVKK